MSSVLLFLLGLGILLAAGHLVIDAATRIGTRCGLTPLVVGLTLIAAATSAPELAVVFQSISVDDTELAVGSIIGSNIANVLLVLGLVAATGAIHVTLRVVRVDIPIMIAASTALLIFSLDGTLTRSDGLMLFAGLVGFVLWTLRSAPRTSDPAQLQMATTPSASKISRSDELRLVPAIVRLVVGIAGLAIAARFVVRGAEEIATSLGVPELVVGLTVVALGTSAPEIATTAMAAFKGHRELAVGNAVGSNIFNILLVLGVTATASPRGIAIGSDAVSLDLPIMVAAAFACLPLVFWDHKLDRWEGVVFLFYYAAYLTFLVLDSTGNRLSDPFALVMLGFVTPLTVLTISIGLLQTWRRKRFTSSRTHQLPIPRGES